MTLKEVREKILTAKDRAWFKEVAISINYTALNMTVQKKGFASIYQYISQQADGWAELEEKNVPVLANNKSFFISIQEVLGKILEDGLQAESQNLTRLWNTRINPFLERVVREKIIPYDVPQVTFLIDLGQKKRQYLEGAFDYLIGNYVPTNKVQSGDYYTGTLLGYEFRAKEFSELAKRRDTEKRGILKLRSDFEKYYDEAEGYLHEYLEANQQKVDAKSALIDELVEEKDKTFREWFEKSTTQEAEFAEKSTSRIKELENLYNEKLKLEAPAQYWKKRAQALKAEGNKWLTGLIVSTAIALILLFVILFFISSATMKEIFSNTGTAIKWSVVFITIVSLLAYSIRTFAKLMFSTFHLMRDAEEREQLAYVYLALRKDKNIDDTERHLVMQTLFSRADTGLLKDDGSPTMPGNIVDKFIGKGAS